MIVYVATILLMLAIGLYGDSNDTPEDNYYYTGNQYVVLVAGSQGWWGYRHQADICHAYQIVKKNGIPEENIIVMMNDDLVNHTRNPMPGTLINQPNGTDVYNNIKIDYKGNDVTAENFLRVILGKKDAMEGIGSGKVVESGPLDNIFIIIESYGVHGLLVFPSGQFLYADQLIDALDEMADNAKYRKMLIFVDTSDAGSLFDGLLSQDKRILAVTASGPREASYACYCGEESGQYGTCLGNIFSTTWMENFNKNNSEDDRYIYKDYQEMRTSMTWSTPLMYGDYGVSFDAMSSFIGDQDQDWHYSQQYPKKNVESSNEGPPTKVDIEIKNKLDIKDKLLLNKQLFLNRKMRLNVDLVFREIYKKTIKLIPGLADQVGDLNELAKLQLPKESYPCYRSIVNHITSSCFPVDQDAYALSKLLMFSNFCAVDSNIDIKIENIIDIACSKVRIPKVLKELQ